MLGIFTGKKEEYNKLILKSLLFGDKEEKDIAKYIGANSKERGKKVISIQKTIRRNNPETQRNGRLQELSNKEYIEQSGTNPKLWTLTGKGLCVGLTLIKNIDDVFPYIIPHCKKTINELKPEFKNIIDFPGMRNKTRQKIISIVIETMSSKKFYQSLKTQTNNMIYENVNFDTMSNNTFDICVMLQTSRKLVERKIQAIGSHDLAHRRLKGLKM